MSTFVFGGLKQTRQISLLYPWGLRRFGTLPFDFQEGLCVAFNENAYLGFAALTDGKNCSTRLSYLIYLPNELKGIILVIYSIIGIT